MALHSSAQIIQTTYKQTNKNCFLGSSCGAPGKKDAQETQAETGASGSLLSVVPTPLLVLCFLEKTLLLIPPGGFILNRSELIQKAKKNLLLPTSISPLPARVVRCAGDGRNKAN